MRCIKAPRPSERCERIALLSRYGGFSNAVCDREARSAPGLTFLTRPGLFYMAWWDAQDCLRVSFSRDGLAWGPQLELTDWEAECGPIALTPSDTLYLACQWSTCFGGAALLR